MILKKPIYYFIPNTHLIDYRGHLFKTLWATFPTHDSLVKRTLANLFTHDQIEFFFEWASANQGFDNDLEMGLLSIDLHDYMENF